MLLTAGLLAQGMPVLSLKHWAMIGWLAMVNTALAFTLWNVSLRTLTAMESSVINNTMSVQIPLLAFVFLGERISGRGLVGLAVAVVGTLLVQFGRRGVKSVE
jgi:drug/metabolite transporter (DMT)-like permease